MILAFIGKGGVGKTSISSAFALELASLGRVIIVSTDFMPSLRYIFSKDDEVKFLELSEKEVAKRWIDRYGEEVFSIISEFINTDRSVLQHISTAPGVAEEFMISELVNIENSGEYEYVVWDTPASSSTMHLLTIERDFYDHLGRDIQYYLRLKEKFGKSNALDILNQWRELANNVWNELSRSNFFLVTTPDDLSLVQSEEISKDFLEMGLRIKSRICNRVKEWKGKTMDCSLRIPELSGKPREIAEKMRSEIRSKVSLLIDGQNF
jgi:arsenite-transporting ATPase